MRSLIACTKSALTPALCDTGYCPVDGILQQRRAKFDALSLGVNGKARQHHDRHGIWHVAPNRTRCHLVRNSTCRHGVVAKYAMIPIGQPNVRLAPLIWLAMARRLSQSSSTVSPQANPPKRWDADKDSAAQSCKLMLLAGWLSKAH